jgi:hypothetical protein
VTKEVGDIQKMCPETKQTPKGSQNTLEKCRPAIQYKEIRDTHEVRFGLQDCSSLSVLRVCVSSVWDRR